MAAVPTFKSRTCAVARSNGELGIFLILARNAVYLALPHRMRWARTHMSRYLYKIAVHFRGEIKLHLTCGLAYARHNGAPYSNVCPISTPACIGHFGNAVCRKLRYRVINGILVRKCSALYFQPRLVHEMRYGIA